MNGRNALSGKMNAGMKWKTEMNLWADLQSALLFFSFSQQSFWCEFAALGTPNSVVGYAWDGPGEWEFSDCGMQSVAYFLPPSAITFVAQRQRNVKMECKQKRGHVTCDRNRTRNTSRYYRDCSTFELRKA